MHFRKSANIIKSYPNKYEQYSCNNKNVSHRLITVSSFYSRLSFSSKYLHSINNGNVFNFSGKKDKSEDS